MVDSILFDCNKDSSQCSQSGPFSQSRYRVLAPMPLHRCMTTDPCLPRTILTKKTQEYQDNPPRQTIQNQICIVDHRDRRIETICFLSILGKDPYLPPLYEAGHRPVRGRAAQLFLHNHGLTDIVQPTWRNWLGHLK